MRQLTDAAVAAVQGGATIVHLTDRPSSTTSCAYGMASDVTYIPPLLAVGAVHHRLIASGVRNLASIIVSTGQAWSTHHVASLVAYGASAVHPYLAYDAVLNWLSQKRVQLAMERGEKKKLTGEQALSNYKKAMDKGLLKILSKMGISLLSSYFGAQIFEAIGLSDAVLDIAFAGTPSRVDGLTLDDIAAETLQFTRKAFGEAPFAHMVEKIEQGVGRGGTAAAAAANTQEDGEEKRVKLFNYGFLNFYRTGEYHHNNQVRAPAPMLTLL